MIRYSFEMQIQRRVRELNFMSEFLKDIDMRRQVFFGFD